MYLIIDRFEGSWAVLEVPDGTVFNFPRSLLPPEAKEGDVLEISLSVNEEATRERRERIRNFLNDLKPQDQGGNVEL
jgi:hypothetical protein